MIVILAAAAIIAQSANPPAPAQTPAAPAAQRPAAQSAATKAPGEDWVALFNGKDLTGWTNIGKEKWEVEDATLHGLAVSREYGYLQTDKSYKDFQLSLRFKCEGDGNSGV